LRSTPATSSDTTNIETRIRRDGADYVINGRKWWTSRALDLRRDGSVRSRQTRTAVSGNR
jgi:hypothetical protein